MTRLLLAVLLTALVLPASAGARPRLVVLFVVDQLRADHLGRIADDLPTETGFRWLLDGAIWPQARHEVLQAMTGPGHSSIAAGAWPARTGIALNRWYTGDGVRHYCVGDPSVRPVPDDGAGKGAPIGPGMLRLPTLGDTLKASGIDGSVVSVSFKDRAATLLAGRRADAVLWFDSRAKRWATSTAWSTELPSWIAPINATLREQLGPDPFDWRAQGPNVDALTAEAVLAAIDGMELGGDDATDLLLVSLSQNDYLGHWYGPLADETRSGLLRGTDAAIARILEHIASQGGLDDVVVALTADHGVPNLPEELAAAGHSAGRIRDTPTVAALNAHLTDTVGPPAGGTWIVGTEDFNYWFADEAVAEPATRASAEETARAWLLGLDGVEFVITRGDVAAGRVPPSAATVIANQYVPGRSGDVIASPQPFWISGNETEGVGHMSRHAYDVVVPILLRGPGVTSGRYADDADVIDLTATLAWLVEIQAPEGAEGRVLREALSAPAPPTSPPSTRRTDHKR